MRTWLLVALVSAICAQFAWGEGGRSLQVDVNRPRSPFECDLPNAESWYGSTQRCLQELCAGRNVYNEYIFDAQNRRRKNPCYRQSPTEFGD